MLKKHPPLKNAAGGSFLIKYRLSTEIYISMTFKSKLVASMSGIPRL